MPQSSFSESRALRVLRLVVSALFAIAIFAKLTGNEQVVAIFAKIGIGQWFRFFTAAVEITGVVLLYFSSTVFWGASLLFGTMVCATLIHIYVVGGSAIPAIALCAMSAILAYLARTDRPTMSYRSEHY